MKSFIHGLCGGFIDLSLLFPSFLITNKSIREKIREREKDFSSQFKLNFLRLGYITHQFALIGFSIWAYFSLAKLGIPYPELFLAFMVIIGQDMLSKIIYGICKSLRITH